MLRTGQHKVDLAVYRFHWDGFHHDMGLEPTVYERAGYSYDFVTPPLLGLPDATVGRFDDVPALMADGSAYKAIVVDMRKSKDNGEWIIQDMPTRTAEILASHAKEGLPIILVGGVPEHADSFG